MFKGWLGRLRDKVVALRTFDDYLESFEFHNKDAEKKAKDIFVTKFYEAHYTARFTYASLRRYPLDKEHSDEIFEWICVHMRQVLSLLNEAKNKEVVVQGEKLGFALGTFLGSIGYGLTSPQFSDIEKKKQRRIIDYVTEINSKMVELGKSIKPTFIAKRMEKISKEHAGRLSVKQQYLIATIAEIFAS